MALRRSLHAALLAVLLAGCGGGAGARTFDDRVGEVEAGTGPDLAAVTVSDTATEVTFAVRFADAPPLRVDEADGWVDMLLIGIDVPPLGPEPDAPGGDWRGVDYAFGTHGPSDTAVLVRMGGGKVAELAVATSGSTMSLSVPRRALGNPDWFTFTVAAGREGAEDRGGGGDFIPASGTLRYTLGD
jgi:hypothetical protein